MIGNISAFLSQVYHLNNTGDNRNTSQEEGKTAGPSECEAQDIVRISGRKTGAALDKQNEMIQKPDMKTSAADYPAGQDQKVVEELKKRDREVRQHEQAHLAAAGGYAKGVSFKTQVGPDGRVYAVGGEVAIDLSEIPGDPDATIAKAQAIRRAASAPAHPSGQDRLVAAAATRMEAKARMEKMQEEKEEEAGGIAAKGTGRTAGRIGSVYSLNRFETGSLINRVA